MKVKDKDELMKWMAFAPSNILTILKGLGFNDIGSFVNYVEKYNE